jgi:shikimate dehydrogenase
MSQNKFSAIIGLKPSKGARSPKLWNKVYKFLKSNIKMIPIDIKRKKFRETFKKLIRNENYIGGAVTMPYKELSLKYLKNFDKKINQIRSINCLLRDKKFNLYGINTDGEAALSSFKNKFKIKKIKKFVILGYGGVGKAVTSYFSEYYKKSKFYVFVRKKYKNHKNIQFVQWKEINNHIEKDINVIINCTSIGFMNKNKSPLSVAQISKLRKKTVIFDVIYQPVNSKLIKIAKKLKLKTLNGLEMNLLQAAISFKRTNKTNLNLSKIKLIMKR